MGKEQRRVYVISDLHIGGRYGTPAAGDRGFRICTHADVLARFIGAVAASAQSPDERELVINGDFIDFLAEEDEGGWSPFLADPDRVLERLNVIAERDAGVFRALRDLVARGQRLTILLGNHDVELSFPRVRGRLEDLLGAPIRFLYDGEAYWVGDALIEHGNRYDGFNIIDHDALRRVRSLQSRHLPVSSKYEFPPPVGSQLVAGIMNPLKQLYPFIDLLKPETEAVLPILLALEPGVKRHLGRILNLKREAAKHAPIAPAEPAYGSEIYAETSPSDEESYGSDTASTGTWATPSSEDEALMEALSACMGEAEATRFLEQLDGRTPDTGYGEDIASYGHRELFGLGRLLVAGGSAPLEKRLPALLDALRVVQKDRSFDPSFETEPAYLDAATKLSEHGARFVVFGHTHLAKHISLGDNRFYLNTGTWADLIRFPKEILLGTREQGLAQLGRFVAELAARRFDAWITFKPSYARLDVEGDRVKHAELCFYRDGEGI